MGELGERMGVNKSTIQRYEMNGVSADRNYLIVSLADALETNPLWLVGQTEQIYRDQIGDSIHGLQQMADCIYKLYDRDKERADTFTDMFHIRNAALIRTGLRKDDPGNAP